VESFPSYPPHRYRIGQRGCGEIGIHSGFGTRRALILVAAKPAHEGSSPFTRTPMLTHSTYTHTWALYVSRHGSLPGVGVPNFLD
jgi:hypothetical protein